MPSDYSLKKIRQQFKENGVFYTSPELAAYMASFVEHTPRQVYDPTVGRGNLLEPFADCELYGSDIDADAIAYCKEHFPGGNFEVCDILANDIHAGMTFDTIVANPPFSVKWDRRKGDPRFDCAPALAPAKKADWAFNLHIMHHLADDGIALVIGYPGILYRGNSEGKIRQYFVEQNWVDQVIEIPAKSFTDTAISTVMLVLKKNRQTTDITFATKDGTKKKTVTLEQVKEERYVLSPNTYLFEDEKPKMTPEEDFAYRLSQESEIRQLVISHTKKALQMSAMIAEFDPQLAEVMPVEQFKQDLIDAINSVS